MLRCRFSLLERHGLNADSEGLGPSLTAQQQDGPALSRCPGNISVSFVISCPSVWWRSQKLHWFEFCTLFFMNEVIRKYSQI